MNRYRVTIPPFEVEADSPEEAEEIVEQRIDEGEYNFEIEEIEASDGGIIRVCYTDEGRYEYELDSAHTTRDAQGWTSTRWKPVGFATWFTALGHWPASITEETS